MFKVHQIPVLTDNYIYILECSNTGASAIVDPAQADAVSSYVHDNKIKPEFILNTHHHFDHVGGNNVLKKQYGLTVYAPKYDVNLGRIPGADNALVHGDEVLVGQLRIEIIAAIGHTLGHIMYYLPDHGVLFCGDALFSFGCGRIFEGTYQNTFETMSTIKQLPQDTMVYCTHEYTEKNIKFCQSNCDFSGSAQVDFDKIANKVKTLRSDSKPTVPFRLGDELLLNPFLAAKNVEELAHFRKLRDKF